MPGGWTYGCLQFLFLSNHGILGNRVLPHTRACTPHPASISCSWFPDVLSGLIVPLQTEEVFSLCSNIFFFFFFLFFLFVRVGPRWVCTSFYNILASISCDNSEMVFQRKKGPLYVIEVGLPCFFSAACL